MIYLYLNLLLAEETNFKKIYIYIIMFFLLTKKVLKKILRKKKEEKLIEKQKTKNMKI